MFGENKEEKIDLPKKNEKQIERELLDETKKTMFEHADKDKGPTKENSPLSPSPAWESFGSGGSGASQAPAASIPIPQEIPQAIMGGFNFLVYEKRIQRLHKEHQDDARKVIKPTEKQVQVMGNLLTWIADRYAPSLVENPWFVPATMLLEIGRIEFVKYQAFNAVVEASKGGEK